MADQPFSAGRFLNFESYWPTAAYSNLKLPLTSVLACFISDIERGERNVALINIKKSPGRSGFPCQSCSEESTQR
jgi:hypothetical protein